MNIEDRLEAAAVKAEGASEIMRQFANLGENAYVETESGPLPSIPEWLRLNAVALGGVPALTDRVDTLETSVQKASLMVASVAELRNTQGRYNKDQVILAGYHAELPGIGGGQLWWDSVSTAADNSGTVFAVTGVPTGRWRRHDNGFCTIEAFGAYEGQDVSACTAAINAAINAMPGRRLIIPARRYKYNGTNLTTSICLVGERMPQVNSDRSALFGGSILEGTAFFRPVEGWFENFGVDHGSAAFATGADAFKCSTQTPSSGRVVVVKDVVGLGRHPDDLFHAILVEGYGRAYVDNLLGVMNYHGCALKANKLLGGRIFIDRPGLYGLIVKSDSTHGSAADVLLGQVTVEGGTETGVAVQLESADVQFNRVHINGINGRDVQSLVRVSGGVIATDISLKGLVGTSITGDAIRQEGLAYQLRIADVTLSGLGGRAAIFGDTRHLQVLDMQASAAVGNLNFDTDFVSVGASCVRVDLSAVNLVSNYSSATAGMVKFDNSRGQNTVRGGFSRLSGVGAPVEQIDTISAQPAGTTTRQTYKIAAIDATYAGTAARQFNLLTTNTQDGHELVFRNTTGQNVVIGNSAGGTLGTLNSGQYGRFRLVGGEFVLINKAAI